MSESRDNLPRLSEEERETMVALDVEREGMSGLVFTPGKDDGEKWADADFPGLNLVYLHIKTADESLCGWVSPPVRSIVHAAPDLLAALTALLKVRSVAVMEQAAREYPHGQEDVQDVLDAFNAARAAIASATVVDATPSEPL